MFAREGAAIIAAGRRKEPLSEVVREIRREGGKADYLETDVRNEEQVTTLVRKTLDIFGSIDIVVASAGINPSRTNILDTTELAWKETIDTNLTGAFLTCKYAIPPMIDQNGGSLIIISSMVGMTGVRERIPYAASKGGVNQLVRCLAVDHARYNIRANGICPGRILTEFNKELWGRSEEVSRLYPLGLRGRPEDIAYAGIYLASDESSWVTGVLLPVDGGYLAQ